MLDKKIIVTGGTYGIGGHLVAALAAAGATVATMARGADLGERNAADLSAKGPGCVRFYRCDVSNRAQVKSAFAAAVADMGGLDALVHLAGVESGAWPETETDENWDFVMDVNAKGTFIANQEAFPYLKENGGRILNFGSGAATLGFPAGPSYAASKGAVAAWTRTIAMAWGQYDIAANIICPTVMTPMYAEYRERMTPEQLRRHDEDMAAQIHIGGKMGDIDRDLVPALLFYLSDGARYITGQTINIDGGVVKAR